MAVSILDSDHIRLHLGLDLLVADVVSFKIIIDDLADLYLNDTAPKATSWSFANYNKIKNEHLAASYQEDKAFWENRIKNITPGCNLPFATRPESLSNASYTRRSFTLSRNDYQSLKNLASENRTTVAMILLALYSIVLSRWSGQKDILINIPLFNRDLSVKDTDTAVADFTDLTLLNVSVKDDLSLLELSKDIQKNFYDCYSHSSFSGLEVQKLIRNSNGIVAPVVFSCTEGMEQFSKKCVDLFGMPEFIITQTPQVFIDFQIFQADDELRCIWDVPNDLFKDDMINEMFATLEKGVRDFIYKKGDLSFNCLNKIFDNSIEYSAFNVTDENFSISESSEEFLYSGFYDKVIKTPDKTALIDSETDISYTYKELGQAVSFMANKLVNAGVKPGTKVALTVQRGVKEIIGILSILWVGGCYIPITPGQPEERRHQAMNSMGVNYVLVDHENIDKIPNNVSVITYKQGIDEDILVPVKTNSSLGAYIILTSGTTGTPKGVEISHASALNTIKDVNHRISYSPEDKILAVSSIDFDLSVYDIFGTFQGGGTLVVMGKDHYRDAEFWKLCVNKYNITLWNSVPLLFDMLLTVSENSHTELSLRGVMLSGDWILSTLYERLSKLAPDCRFIGMGGATEASIWSNWYEVHSSIDIRGKFIPYGRPLTNQGYRIVDKYLRDCPHHAIGELLIGGKGVALGYYNDSTKTASKFITLDNNRWYKTGDKGYFDSDGTIVFLGRIDEQCKVRGHRIEVEEIEKHLGTYFQTENAVCWPAGPKNAYNHLEACIFNHPKELTKKEMSTALDYLKVKLPSYMIPTIIYTGTSLPMTANGKADRKKIREMFKDSNKNASDSPSKNTSDDYVFNKTKNLWCKNLDISDALEDDNYYFSGGDSLKAIRLSSSINEAFNVNLSTSEVLEAQTLGDLSKKICWRLNK